MGCTSSKGARTKDPREVPEGFREAYLARHQQEPNAPGHVRQGSSIYTNTDPTPAAAHSHHPPNGNGGRYEEEVPERTNMEEPFAPVVRAPRSTRSSRAISESEGDDDEMVLVCADCGLEICRKSTPANCAVTNKRHS